MTPEISVVILCYGAGKRIYGFIDKIVNILENTIPSWEIILVGNYFEGSDDETPEIVKEIASKKEHVKAIAKPKEGMMSWDARSGIAAADGNFICLIDGDDQMPPEDILRVYNLIKEKGLDFVKTYRAKRYDGASRVILSFFYNLFFRMLFPGIKVRDINSKPKIISRQAYERMKLISNDWFLDPEMMIEARRLKLKLGELPTTFYKCEYRDSFVRLDTSFEFFKNLLKARIKEFFIE